MRRLDPGASMYALQTRRSHRLCPSRKAAATLAIATIDDHSFLCSQGLKEIPPEDVTFLWSKGSLSFPDRESTAEFLDLYFKKVHPLLPVVDEVHIWHVFEGNVPDKLSLFVFQSILFAACQFVSLDTIQKCGYYDKRDARKQLFDKSRLLFDFNVETKPSAKAQGAVLLTHYLSGATPQAQSFWLTRAIENAMIMEGQSSAVAENVIESMKRRIWWSILLRDRSICIGLRRRPQVTSINLHACRDCLTEEDFEHEMHDSRAYDRQTKQAILSSLLELCHLAVLLTDLASLIFAPRVSPAVSYTAEEFSALMGTVEKIKQSLLVWYESAESAKPPPRPTKQQVYDPTAVLRSLTLMYYRCAQIDLAHYCALAIEEYPSLSPEMYQTAIIGTGRDLKAGVDGLTEIIEYFSLNGHGESLPLSVLAYTGMPLILAAIDLKLSSTREDIAQREKRLNCLSGIIRHSETLFDVTDFVAAGTNYLLQLAYWITQNLFLSGSRSPLGTGNRVSTGDGDLALSLPHIHQSKVVISSRAKSWLDAFIKYPRAYLFISTSVDHYLSVGRMPYGNDLPALVRDIPAEAPWVTTAYPAKGPFAAHFSNSPTSHMGLYRSGSVVSGKAIQTVMTEEAADQISKKAVFFGLHLGSQAIHQITWEPSPRPHRSLQQSDQSHVNLDFLDLGGDTVPDGLGQTPTPAPNCSSLDTFPMEPIPSSVHSVRPDDAMAL
ncbi:Transcription factor [Penicillium chermesinum]|uniref:Transcription factor n=1 Tax=Penicillium chermesinum TaxID=63820 RepID=A0A9W9PFD3_9EURO|nr:Transcription factor [Penicillium chermesinum]KAJ5245809.1 Transcription factor [Penicillium chermesinum]